MKPSRGNAVVVGAFFVLAAVAAVAGLALYQPALSDPGYVLGAGADTQVLLGGFLEVVLAVSCIGTAVTIYPVIRRHAPAASIAYVAGRLLEAAVICVGIVATLALVTLRQDRAAGVEGTADDGALLAVAHGLVAVHDWTFLLGPGLVIGLNTLVLASVVHRAHLAPRAITVLGLVGGPLVLLSSTLVLFGVYEQVSPVAGAAAIPVAAWEMSLAVYLIVKGYRAPAQPPVASDVVDAGRRPVTLPA
ncbi:DUF4386 domain-containing protein [Cellulomonas septica]|uniref:DUF4386 domain-containing protein n=1 Tax=Cellulomonas septica TaxID=285080 RepID=A0ABX1JYJ7_9CELL|nr:DUF4386 domain-containing protein [Cellulomonas septica]NKY38820.1 DUF4386 domain-containing protein [Cellulomonas septica]